MPHYLIRCGDALSQLVLRIFRTVQFNVWAIWLLSLEAWDTLRHRIRKSLHKRTL